MAGTGTQVQQRLFQWKENGCTIAQLLINWGIIYLGKFLHSKHLLSEIFTIVSPQQVSGAKAWQGNNLTVMQVLCMRLSLQTMNSQSRNSFLVEGGGA